MSIKCPQCNGECTVIDGRFSNEQRAYRRRKECVECGHRFTTWESDIAPKIMRTKRIDNAKKLLQITEILNGNLVKQFKRPPKGVNIT